VWSFGCGVQGLRLRAQGSGLRVQGPESRVQGSGIGVYVKDGARGVVAERDFGKFDPQPPTPK